MNTHDEFSQTTPIYNLGNAVSVNQATTEAYYLNARPVVHGPKLPSIDDLVADILEDPEMAPLFAEANKEIAREYYADERSLRALRLSRGWTQTELAKLAETSQAQINKLENGQIDFRASTANKLAEVFGLRRSEMYAILTGESA